MKAMDLKGSMRGMTFGTPHEKAFCEALIDRIGDDQEPRTMPLLLRLLGYDITHGASTVPAILRHLSIPTVAVLMANVPAIFRRAGGEDWAEAVEAYQAMGRRG